MADPSSDEVSRSPAWYALLPASLAALLGLAILFSWFTRGPLVIRALPAPTANTGLALLLCALGYLLLESRRWPAVSIALATLVFLWSSVIGLQYLTVSGFGLDRVLISPYVSTGARIPGRMSLASLCCFLLLSSALAAAVRGKRSSFFCGIAGAAVGAVSLVVLAGHLAGAPALTAWGSQRPMSWMSAAAFASLAGGLLRRAWLDGRDPQTLWPSWAPLAVGLMALICTACVSHAMYIRQHTSAEQWRDTTASPAEKAWIEAERARAGDAWLPVVVFSMGLVVTALLGIATTAFLEGRRKLAAVVASRRQLEVEVAERERATERLRASEAERRTLIDNIPGAVYRCEVAPPWRVLYISADIENISGRPPTEFLSGRATLGGLILPEDLDAVVEECREGTAAGRPFDLEYRIRHTDGSLRWIQERGRAVYDSDGRPRLLDGVMFDITSRIRAERALKQSEYWLNESQRISGTGSYVLDVRTGHWRSSPALDDILGIGPDYIRTREGWIALVHHDDQASVAALLRQDVLQHHHTFDREYRILRACDGKIRWVHGRGALFPDEGGHSLTLAGTIQDITDRRQIEEQFRQSQKMESVGRLAGGVAHDFNNLLTVINGYSELVLASLPENVPLRAPIEEVRKAGERASSLTRQLLAFSRRQLLQPQVLDLNALVRDTERMLRRMIGEDVRLHTVLAADLSPIQADPGQITQVLLNLAVNARDAMPNGGQLTLETSNVTLDEEYAASNPDSRPGSFVQLAVSDNGVGMDPETQEHLFEPFFTTKPQGVGTGLGLSTVYGIVTQSGGWIRVHSQKSAGTTFKIFLPPAAAPVTAPQPSPAVRGELPQGTVLVVEDQESVRRLTSEMLALLGLRVLEAGSGSQALALADAHTGPIDLLLTDVVMPGMTGIQLADAFLRRRPEARVLFMSGYTDSIVAQQGSLDPGFILLEKPFLLDTLVQKVQQALFRVPATNP